MGSDKSYDRLQIFALHATQFVTAYQLAIKSDPFFRKNMQRVMTKHERLRIKGVKMLRDETRDLYTRLQARGEKSLQPQISTMKHETLSHTLRLFDYKACAALRGYRQDPARLKTLTPERLCDPAAVETFAEYGYHNLAQLCAIGLPGRLHKIKENGMTLQTLSYMAARFSRAASRLRGIDGEQYNEKVFRALWSDDVDDIVALAADERDAKSELKRARRTKPRAKIVERLTDTRLRIGDIWAKAILAAYDDPEIISPLLPQRSPTADASILLAHNNYRNLAELCSRVAYMAEPAI